MKSTTGSNKPTTRSVNPDDPAVLKNKINLLEDDLKRRQADYILRERAHLTKIEELQEEVGNYRNAKSGWMQMDAKSNKLKEYQEQILQNVELVQDRTGKILQEQERDLLRAFRARLFDIQTELERERTKKDEGGDIWAEKGRQLEAELEWSKEVSDKLERINHGLTAENARLKSQHKSQEEDRTFLIKQLVAVKKENAKFRSEFTAIEAENKEMHDKVRSLEDDLFRRPAQSESSKNRTEMDSESRYKELNARLQRQLAEERKNLHQVRLNYAQELRSRTEMECLLRNAVDDIRSDIAKRQLESARNLSPSKHSVVHGTSIQDFTPADRSKVLEMLLSQEKVVSLLYSKAFPISNSSGGMTLKGGEDKSSLALAIEDDAVDKKLELPPLV